VKVARIVACCVLVALGAWPSVPAPGSAQGGEPVGWEVERGGFRHLASLAVAPSGQTWAVGAGPDFTELAEYASGAWRLRHVVDSLRARSIDLLDSRHGWAVGDAGAILQFDGARWTAAHSPTEANLRSVSAVGLDDVWAVGERVILHYDGLAWEALTPPSDHMLNDVRMLSRDDGWAVGASGSLLRFDGRAWAAVTSSLTASLNSVDFAGPTYGLAVGNAATLVFDGQAWLPLSGQLPNLVSVSVAAPDQAWAVDGGAAIWQFDGQTWSMVQNWPSFQLRDIEVGSQPAWAVGGASVVGLFGQDWQPVTPLGWYDALDIRAAERGASPTGWAMGDLQALRFQDGRWSPHSQASPAWVADVSAVSDAQAWAVDARGSIIQFDGTAWRDTGAYPDEPLERIQMTSARLGWIAGPRGKLLRYDGRGWGDEWLPTSDAVSAMDMSGPLDGLVAAGERGLLLRRAGGEWRPEGSLGLPVVEVVTRAGQSWALAQEGADGVALFKHDGRRWLPASSLRGVTLARRALAVPHDCDVWVLAAQADLYHFDCYTWRHWRGLGGGLEMRALEAVPIGDGSVTLVAVGWWDSVMHFTYGLGGRIVLPRLEQELIR
jgi:hypothetical protein